MRAKRQERTPEAEAEIAIMTAQFRAILTANDKRTPEEKLEDALKELAEAREHVRKAALAVVEHLKPGQEGGAA